MIKLYKRGPYFDVYCQSESEYAAVRSRFAALRSWFVVGSGVLICGGDVVSMYGSAENEKVALSSALNAKSCPGPLIKVKALIKYYH